MTLLPPILRTQGLQKQAATHRLLPWVLDIIKVLTLTRPVLPPTGPAIITIIILKTSTSVKTQNDFHVLASARVCLSGGALSWVPSEHYRKIRALYPT